VKTSKTNGLVSNFNQHISICHPCHDKVAGGHRGSSKRLYDLLPISKRLVAKHVSVFGPVGTEARSTDPSPAAQDDKVAGGVN
jgi:hypothetical protein